MHTFVQRNLWQVSRGDSAGQAGGCADVSQRGLPRRPVLHRPDRGTQAGRKRGRGESVQTKAEEVSCQGDATKNNAFDKKNK